MRTKDRSTDYWLVLLTVTVEQDINILYNERHRPRNLLPTVNLHPHNCNQANLGYQFSYFPALFLAQTIQKLNNEVLHSRSSLHGGFGYCLCRPL